MSKRPTYFLLSFSLIISMAATVGMTILAEQQSSHAQIKPILASNNSSMLQEFPVPAGSSPHDIAPASDGTVWYTAQASGELGDTNHANSRSAFPAIVIC